ncbi:hypothetical protein D6D01_00185 [Aureobasidium pullulans]|uniref:ubiquitinyl hydrolase 1 n=1 Tax=Aureobasidium pullulans TaxID=5580 RepID=A0A4S9M2S7_AURPU|nr:hypothetical protein D6D01_00185 [Aureobasidium pullulans]
MRLESGAVSAQDLRDLTNHIALPPQLPQSEDPDRCTINKNLLHLLQDVTEIRDRHTSGAWNSVTKMLRALDESEQAGILRDDMLDTHLSALGTGDCFALHLPLQNAAVLVLRKNQETVVVESFEVSAANDSVMSTQGRLVRSFPGRAVACPSNEFFDAAFQSQFQVALRRLAAEAPPSHYNPTATKSGNTVHEERDTTNPGFVNDYLMTILSVVGENHASTTTEKHVRDEILWHKTNYPWRRAAFWLFLRVAILRTLSTNLDSAQAHKEYKLFMIEVVTRLTELACDVSVEPSMLSALNNKLARRAFKFEQRYGEFDDPVAQMVSENARQILQRTWSRNVNDHSAIEKLSVVGWANATSLALSDARKPLAQALAPLISSKQSSAFASESPQRIAQDLAKLPSFSLLHNAKFVVTALADLEVWVEKHLHTWTEMRLTAAQPSACDELAALMRSYWSQASSQYECSPVEKSNALLILTELWVALDTICTSEIPLMLEYPPEIPVNTFECLLLPKAQQMRRLSAVELYIGNRLSRASRPAHSVFTAPTGVGFPVRYYEQTPSLHDLRTRITEADAQRRVKKTEELAREMKKYNQAMAEIAQMECDKFWNRKGYQYHDKRRCRKCKKKDAVQAMRICGLEESLPREDILLKAAIFELKIPAQFAAWRDATWLLLNDVGQRQKGHHPDSVHTTILGYTQLAQHVTRKTRITLGSKIKPALDSHYKTTSLPTTISSICHPNGLRYEIWDCEGKQWSTWPDKPPDFKSHCTLQLPSGPYENLQWTVSTTAHSTNQVMSRQHECDVRLEKEEFLAFGSLRAGERVQSINILRELGCSNLDHTNLAVTTLILQATWEAGSSACEISRQAHMEFSNPRFRNKLLALLRRRLVAIEHNWDKQYSMMTVIQLSLRLLSLASDDDTENNCLILLRDAREVAIKWCYQLEAHIYQSSHHEDVQNNAVTRLLLVALLCYSTFDVEARHLHHLLGSANDLALAAKAQAIVCDSAPIDKKSLPLLLQQSLLHHSKVAHKLEPHVQQLLQLHGSGLNSAIQHIWNGVVLNSEWTIVSQDSRSWVQNKTIPAYGGQSQTVYFNLLSGQLLVDGKSVGKVPDNIRSAPLFSQIFGSSVLRVFASDIPGMESRVSQLIEGHEIHLGLRGRNIVIKARFDGRTLQALPQSTFKNCLPAHFVKPFHHWLDEATGDVEFRPLKRPWERSTNNWRMTFSTLDFATGRAQLRLGSNSLIELSSVIGREVTHVLSVLDTAANCHITLDSFHPSRLEVELPRYNLHFAVTKDGDLTSLEFNAVVDPCQKIDTMIGLRNKLVLRSVVPSGCPEERQVLVPYGELIIRKVATHVEVKVRDEEGPKRQHFVYTLDRHLRKLRGAQDTLALLYQAYLHAVTSFCLPDPFTGSTGVEEAIEILQGASLFSSLPLKKQEIKLLETIAALTPEREFYPPHMKVMQSVSWNPNLPAHSQHDDFVLAAQAIVEHRQKYEKAHGQKSNCSIERGDQSLLERARKRNMSVVKTGFVKAVTRSTDDDHIYTDRGEYKQNPRAESVHEIASTVQDWPSRLSVHTNLASVLKQCHVSGYRTSFDHSKVTMHQLTTLQILPHWGSLYNMCRSAQKNSMLYPLMFTFCAVALEAQTEDMLHIRTLLAFAFSGSFSTIDAPAAHDEYKLANGSSSSGESIMSLVKSNATMPSFPSNASEEQYNEYIKEMSEFNDQTDKYARLILEQWPKEILEKPDGSYPMINVNFALQLCEAQFSEWHKNKRFLVHLELVNQQLIRVRSPHIKHSWPQTSLLRSPRQHLHSSAPSLDQLLSQHGRSVPRDMPGSSVPIAPLSLTPAAAPADSENGINLKRLTDTISTRQSSTHKDYASILSSSVEAFRTHKVDLVTQNMPLDGIHFEAYHAGLSRLVKDLLGCIRHTLAPRTNAEIMLSSADLWPRGSESDLLRSLSAAKIEGVSPSWKPVLLLLAESIASLQRSERMLVLHQKQNYQKLYKELRTPGREGWSADEHPSWLLLEIENNITIRALQAKVAKEMMSPSSGSNSVMQLNMGEGKSSVIVPMLATALADGDRLVRIVVLKPLLLQTEQVLTQRLGGILGHRICHIPFSRKTMINIQTISGISEVVQDCRRRRGIMIVLPEEILSMKLMSREKMISDKTLAASILDLQRSLSTICRDIIDESDEILGIKSQLIYPVGSQHMLDGKSDRWRIAQGVLRQVKVRVIELSEKHPSHIHSDLNGKSFPVIKILKTHVFNELLESLVTDAIDGLIAGVSFDYFPTPTIVAIRNFIQTRDVSGHDLSIIKRDCQETSHWTAILVFRGFFAHDLLSFVLQRKRWLVEYGLDLERCLMAVPYRAKGIPTQNSEFGHPDVAVLLTCLSYYYTGLSMAQIEDCFKILLKDTNAQDIYRGWALAGNLPANLSSLDAINIDDQLLCRESVFPHMKFNLETIDFYLNQVVFPKEGKEFAKRLSASGWDIPSPSSSKKLLTTGFSGTNDSRVILPHSIQQQDLGELLHTNAMVLDLILRPENQTYIHAGGEKGKKLSVRELLSLISEQSPLINVLIDVGAQVLEATNLQLVQQWLQIRADAKAAIYFDDRDEAMVLDRSGSTTPLRISPLSGKLDGCLFYIDEVHTRGIDLAIPMGAHAAVTLGPRLVKDRLTQACMRLRSLGNGHSLCFVSPTEVHRSICDLKGYKNSDQLTSFDVLAWCMEQTCQSLDIARPLRAMHGLEYVRQQTVLHEILPATSASTKLIRDDDRIQRFRREIQEDESRPLELLYGVHEERIGAFKRLLDRDSDNPTMQHLVIEYDSMNKTYLEDCTVDNEQERELAHEVERQRQVERPKAAKACLPHVSKGLAFYINDGTEGAFKNSASKHAFAIFKDTSALEVAKKQKVNPAAFSDLYVSQDFSRTVTLTGGSLIDDYLRPVNWVLSSSEHQKLMVISQHEVNELMLQIRSSSKIHLHTFAPLLNKAMVSFNDMNYFVVGAHSRSLPCADAAVLNLNLFAGSLYLENVELYDSLRCFLGLVSQSRRAGDLAVNSDGFVDPQIREAIGWLEPCPFVRSPLPFLKEVCALLRSGKGFAQTHMGYLFEGRALRYDAFEGYEEVEKAETGDRHVPGEWNSGQISPSRSTLYTLVLR